MANSDISTMSRRTGLSPLELVAIVVFLVAFGLRVWLALTLDLDGDEAYYALWANWPSLAYLDHPPGVALSIWAGEAIFGTSVLGVRAFALFAQMLVAAALFRTTRLLVPDRDAAPVAVIWYSLSLTAAITFVATPDAPSLLFWTLSVWAAAEAVSRSRPGWWLAVGVFAGLGLVSKYTNAWLGIGLVAYLLLRRDGLRQLATWQLWAGGLLALAVASPVIWWNAVNEWRPFLFQAVRIVTVETRFGALLLEYFVSQALMVGPILMLCSVLGLGYYLLDRGKSGAALALPLLTSVPLLLYFAVHSLHARVEANWLQPVLPMMTVVAAWFVLSIRSSWLRTAALVGHSVLGALLVGVLVVQGLFQPFNFGAADRTAQLRDWGRMAAEIRSIADAHGAQSILADVNYRLSGELFFYGKVAGDPRPVRSIIGIERYQFIPAAERFPRAFPALFVRQNANPPTRFFNQIEQVGSVRRAGRETYTVFIVSDPTDAFPSAD